MKETDEALFRIFFSSVNRQRKERLVCLKFLSIEFEKTDDPKAAYQIFRIICFFD
ncbi:hypothetical protein D920_02814 [Enterococcus faecalis 13-SD-W-01]|nr:hypothetical protein D920_02814 [Enterococcus faecalis 13-SD-W-01]